MPAIDPALVLDYARLLRGRVPRRSKAAPAAASPARATVPAKRTRAQPAQGLEAHAAA